MNETSEEFLKTLSVADLEKRLKDAEFHDYCNSMSDNFYHVSGRYDSMQRYIRNIKNALEHVKGE